MYRPSGDQSFGHFHNSDFNRSSSLLPPVELLMNKSPLLPLLAKSRLESNRILLPSGDQTGKYSQAGLKVNLELIPRCRSISQTAPALVFGSMISTAALSPRGESSTWTYSAGWPTLPISRPVRSNHSRLEWNSP